MYLPSVCEAQLAVGDRARIKYDAHRAGISRVFRGSTNEVVGRITRIDSAGIQVVSRGWPRDIPRASIRRAEVSTGKYRPVGQYALIGGISVAWNLAVLHFLLVGPLGGEFSQNQNLYLGMTAGGALLGAALGQALPTDRWRKVETIGAGAGR
jgi:hypothetical protein